MEQIKLLSDYMKHIHTEIEKSYKGYLAKKGVAFTNNVRQKYGFQNSKDKNLKSVIPSIADMILESQSEYINQHKISFNAKNLYNFYSDALATNQITIPVPYLLLYIKFLGHSDIIAFLNSASSIPKDLKEKQLAILEESKKHNEADQLLTSYDAYGYSLHRKDMFYYFIRIYGKKEKGRVQEKEYNAKLSTYTKEGKFEDDYSGFVKQRGNYAYFHFNIKNSVGEIKREFYLIAYLGDKSVFDANIIYSSYIIASRDMNLSSGFLIMKREGIREDRISEYSLIMRRYFNLTKPQMRLRCYTLMDYNEVKFDHDPDGRLVDFLGTFTLITSSHIKSIFSVHQLEISQDFKCSLKHRSDVMCDIAVKASNIYLNLKSDAYTDVKNNIILKIYSPKLLMGNYLGINIQGNPESGKVVALKSNLNLDVDYIDVNDLEILLKDKNQNEALNFLLGNPIS